MKVNEDIFETLNRVSEITGVDYDIKWFDAENIDGYIDEENLLSMIEDLIVERERIKENFEDYKQNVSDNYRPITDRELYGDYEDYRRERGL